jgi:transposase
MRFEFVAKHRGIWPASWICEALGVSRSGWFVRPVPAPVATRIAFSGWLYRQRNLVERFFNRIKHFRGIATRYDKCPENYLAAVKLICARIAKPPVPVSPPVPCSSGRIGIALPTGVRISVDGPTHGPRPPCDQSYECSYDWS